MNQSTIVIPLIFALMISACANRETRKVSEGKDDAAVNEKPLDELVFKDSRLFDKELSISMKASKDDIEIYPLDKFSLNEIPERMDRWFVAVDQNEGKVETEDISSKKRGVFIAGAVIAVGSAIINKIREKKLYKPAGNYDAILYCEDGIVEKVVFTRKELSAD